MAVYDSFMYCGEETFLEIRIEELWDVVDKFVISESPYTFQSKPKPLYFAESSHKFERYMDKILYLEITEHPNLGGDRRSVEFPMREFFVTNMEFNDNDVFLISDVDEIPRINILKETINSLNDVCKLAYKSCCYYVNCVSEEKWWGPLVITGSRLKELNMSLGVFRDMKAEDLGVYEYPNAGWHFGYTGTSEQLSAKIKRHYKLSRKYMDLNYINKCKENLQDLYRPEIKYEANDGTDLPKYLLDNRERFSYMFHNGVKNDGSNG